MSKFPSEYRKYFQYLRRQELNTLEVNDQLFSLGEKVAERVKAQSVMEYKIPVPPGDSLKNNLYPLISRHILRHSKYKHRCDWNKNTRGARRTRQIGLPQSS